MQVACGGPALGKTQKNALVDDDLCKVIDEFQRYSGATFARVASASLLKLVFGPLQPPPDDDGYVDDQIWMRIAVDIERGDCRIGDVPKILFVTSIEVCDRALKKYSSLASLTPEEDSRNMYWLELKVSIQRHEHRWNAVSAQAGNELRGILRTVGTGGFKPPAALKRDRDWHDDNPPRTAG